MASVDLSELAMAMNSSDIDGYLDPASGEIYLGFGGELLDDDGEPMEEIPDGWIWIEHTPTHEAYEDMVAFAQALPERRVRDRLLDALEGSGAFRRFRNEVHRDDIDLGGEWGAFREARQELRAAQWMADEKLLSVEDLRRVSADLEARMRQIVDTLGGREDAELAEVEALERELQSVEGRADPVRLETLLADDFEEIGASGRLWSRVEVLEFLAGEGPDAGPIEISDLAARRVGEETVLVRWTSARGGRRAVRSSLWRRDPGRWRLVHHQGTPLP